jgi:hypothetical protein
MFIFLIKNVLGGKKKFFLDYEIKLNCRVIFKMCYSAEVSLITYVIGMAGCYLLLHHRQLPEALFYTSVIQMQLIEFFLHIINGCNDWNLVLTRIGIIINHSEPLFLYIGILLWGRKLDTLTHRITLGYTVIASIYTIIALQDAICTVKDVYADGHLYWKWNELSGCVIMYSSFICVLVRLSIMGLHDGVFHAIMCVISYAISLIVYGMRHYAGAWWCLVAAAGPYVLLYRKQKVYNEKKIK